MGIIKQLDKRTGITYVYESKAYWDKEKHQSVNVKQIFTSLGNVFFTLYGKQFFTSYGKEIFIL